ncbi:MAG: hypothetical protein QM767_04895 [Anaeromyxobacter sp.]
MSTTSTSLKPLAAALLALAAAGCSSNTEITRSWSDPESKGAQFKKPMVVVLAAEDKRRVTAEDKISAQLQSRGVEAVRSHDVLGDEDLGDREKDQGGRCSPPASTR